MVGLTMADHARSCGMYHIDRGSQAPSCTAAAVVTVVAAPREVLIAVVVCPRTHASSAVRLRA